MTPRFWGSPRPAPDLSAVHSHPEGSPSSRAPSGRDAQGRRRQPALGRRGWSRGGGRGRGLCGAAFSHVCSGENFSAGCGAGAPAPQRLRGEGNRAETVPGKSVGQPAGRGHAAAYSPSPH